MFYFCFLMNARSFVACIRDRFRREDDNGMCAILLPSTVLLRMWLGLSFRLQSEEGHPGSRDSRATILGHTVH